MAATRAALIEAAVEEFSASGLDASLDGICERAGLTRGAFYVHFADREALIRAVVQHVLGGQVAALAAVGAGAGATARAIELFVAAARARSPAVHGGRKLRFFHVLDACHRSRALGDDYRGIVLSGRDQIAESLALDQRARAVRSDLAAESLADLLVAVAFGITAILELELPVDLARLGATMQTVIARHVGCK